ncbi:FliI/YscN family ATPase [Alteromonas sp. S015]|uniref:FliI/YscN family ATPase n=1 Tax=Alteromonas sp. S015 TaxID=3117401 RepID=UPI002FE2B6C1
MKNNLAARLSVISNTLTRTDSSQTFGRLTQINGMVLSVIGGEYTLGKSYQVENAQGKWIQAQVIGFNGDTAYLMPLEHVDGISTNARVKATSHKQRLYIGEELLGRVIDGLGKPIDNKGEFSHSDPIDPSHTLLNPLEKDKVRGVLDVGIRALNGLFTVGMGQRLGLFAGSGVGKSKLLGMITRFTSADIVVVGLVGERGWEVREFIEDSLGEEGLAKSIVIAAPADVSPLMRMKCAENAHVIANWFRDQGKNVLLLVDSLTRYAQAQREIALSAGEPPATKGYPPSVFGKLTRLVEMAGNSVHSEGSMTAIYTVLAEGDDQQDPIVDGARAILDGHVVLSRVLAEQGHYPAIDIGASISRVMPNIVAEDQLKACYLLKRLYSKYKQVEELIPLGAHQSGKDLEMDKAVNLYPNICQFLTQSLNEKVDFHDSSTQLRALVEA